MSGPYRIGAIPREDRRLAGDLVDTALCGRVRLLREMRGQSSVDGWEVRLEDGRTAYLTYDDFELTEESVAEIRAILSARPLHGAKREAK